MHPAPVADSASPFRESLVLLQAQPPPAQPLEDLVGRAARRDRERCAGLAAKARVQRVVPPPRLVPPADDRLTRRGERRRARQQVAHARATGGREGTGTSDDGRLSIKLGTPIEMGGKGDGTNPEQMFAVGYASCLIGALKFVAAERKKALPEDTAIDAAVSFGTRPGGARGFNIDVSMEVTIPGMDREAEALVHEAQQVCPYSNATGGNVDVALTVA